MLWFDANNFSKSSIIILFLISLVSCGTEEKVTEKEKKQIEHMHDNRERLPASLDSLLPLAGSDRCPDVTEGEMREVYETIKSLGGSAYHPNDYDMNQAGLQKYLDDSGVSHHFSAREMLAPNRPDKMKKCGLKNLMPPRCRWPSGVAQALIAMELRAEINDGVLNGRHGINLRNWYRPECYNKEVGGAEKSDHRQARGFDLDFKSPRQRAVAQKYLCEMYKERKLNLQVGIGCQTLHIGVGSPKRLSHFPNDGSRWWTYGSLKNCPLKRIEGDDCWKTKSNPWRKTIHTNKPGYRGGL